jgi:thiamine-phosphate pyrophosphorylase
VITDEQIARRPGRILEQIAQRLSLAGRSRVAFHARGRGLTGDEHLYLARLLPPPRFINDRLDIALAVDAQGVQLPQSSFTMADARRLGPQWWIGRSVHNLPEAEAAIAEGADYLLVGPVFATTTHPERAAMGTGLFSRIAGLGLPAIAIGGISRQRVREVAAAGAYGVAAIRAFWDAADPVAEVKGMLEVLNDDD